MKPGERRLREREMKNLPLYWVAVLATLTACTSGVPYRNGDYRAIPSCEKTYGAYDAALLSVAAPPERRARRLRLDTRPEIHFTDSLARSATMGSGSWR